eukprot:Gb_25937 [translate_table: standard]
MKSTATTTMVVHVVHRPLKSTIKLWGILNHNKKVEFSIDEEYLKKVVCPRKPWALAINGLYSNVQCTTDAAVMDCIQTCESIKRVGQLQLQLQRNSLLPRLQTNILKGRNDYNRKGCRQKTIWRIIIMENRASNSAVCSRGLNGPPRGLFTFNCVCVPQYALPQGGVQRDRKGPPVPRQHLICPLNEEEDTNLKLRGACACREFPNHSEVHSFNSGNAARGSRKPVVPVAPM